MPPKWGKSKSVDTEALWGPGMPSNARDSGERLHSPTQSLKVYPLSSPSELAIRQIDVTLTGVQACVVQQVLIHACTHWAVTEPQSGDSQYAVRRCHDTAPCHFVQGRCQRVTHILVRMRHQYARPSTPSFIFLANNHTACLVAFRLGARSVGRGACRAGPFTLDPPFAIRSAHAPPRPFRGIGERGRERLVAGPYPVQVLAPCGRR